MPHSYDENAELTFRDACAGDAPFLAWAILTAALGRTKVSVWDLALPGSEADRLDFLERLVVAEPPSAAHYSGFIIAESEGLPIATACGFIPAEKTPEAFTEALLSVANELQWSEERQMDLLKSFTIFARCLPMDRGDNWVLEYIATKPAARGKGVTQELLEDLLECGREAGATVSQVAYFVGNEPAMKAYRKLDFKETHEVLDPEFEAQFGSPGVVHMLRKL